MAPPGRSRRAPNGPLQKAAKHPLLKNFRVLDYPGFFSLSKTPHGRSISIRSQTSLAVNFVLSAKKIGLISHDRALLVVGAGAAGISAALVAAQFGVPVTIRETEKAPFSRQANCPTRWLHPHEYDWPNDWFTNPSFPSRKEDRSTPLRWKADFASKVAAQWREQYAKDKRGRRVTEWFSSPELKSEHDYNALAKECSKDPKTGAVVEFFAFLFCRGFAPERVDVGSYSGFQFWEEDPYERRRAGLKVKGPAHLIIDGLGDGGVQDLIRLVFGPTRPGELAQAIAQTLTKDADDRDAWQRLCNELSEKGARVGPRVSLANDPCTRFIASLRRDSVERLFERLSPLFVFDFKTDSIRLVCATGMPEGFALNRLIFRIVERFVTDQLLPHRALVTLGVITDVVGSSGHTCSNDPAACHGVLHECRLGDATVPFHSLIIRHGLAPEVRPIELPAPKPPATPARAS